jgi:5-methyltetrahydrofolate--homocysteine methyltransferase
MTPFLERIEEDPLVCFGALGTMVMDKGFDLADCLGQWLLDHPDENRWLTAQYVDVGCKLLGSAGSMGCRWRLEKWGLEDRVVEINREVTRAVKAAAPEDCYVAGIVMHCGRMLTPLGDLEPEALSDAFREEFVGYAEGGADVLWVATMMDLDEAVTAVRAARDVCGLPVIASMSFDFGVKGARTMMGVDPKTAAVRLVEAGADVVGHNCGGASPAESTRIMREMSEVTDKPLATKPNGGEPNVVDGKTVWPFTPEQYAAEAPNWVAAGARIVGGCCGTTPQHAASMYAALREGD